MDRSSRIRRAAKAAIAQVLYSCGLFRLWQSIALRHRAVVLMYHRVLSDADLQASGSHPGIVVRERTFSAQMAMLKRRFVVLSPEQFAEHVRDRRPFPDSSCLITFDDGWQDTHARALPILRAHGLPALVFLPVNFIGRRRVFWRETLTHLLSRAIAHVRQHPEARPRFESLLSTPGLQPLLTITEPDPRAAVSEAIGQLKESSSDSVAELIRSLSDALSTSPEAFVAGDGFIDWDQVGTMARAGITFGGHGAEHRLLTHVPPVEARREIEASRTAISERVPGPVRAFSYPNGNWSPEIAEQVEAAGFSLAFTTQPGFADSGNHPYSLPRVNIHEGATDTPALFMARVLGLF